jgi:tRNA pseudouridine38-40 synthase
VGQASAEECTPMAAYKSIVAYDGTDFHGFQRQRENLRTVQMVLEEALRSVGWRGTSLHAAGRTDAGVHARGQVIAYTLAWQHTLEDLTRALNSCLPHDVSVRETNIASGGFHPRFSARSRIYRYSMLVREVRDPIRERFAWRIWPEPSYEAMLAFARALIGRHEFRAFGRAPQEGTGTVREIYAATLTRSDGELTFEIEANAFLHRMVRRIVGAAFEIGIGRIGLEEVLQYLNGGELRWQGVLAPARGLCLEQVNYPDAG